MSYRVIQARSDLGYIGVREETGDVFRIRAVTGARGTWREGLAVGTDRTLTGIALATGRPATTDEYSTIRASRGRSRDSPRTRGS